MSLIGLHVSISGGLLKAVERGESQGCEAIQIFTKNQLQWKAPPVSPSQGIGFVKALRDSGIRRVVAHASYLINLAGGEFNARRAPGVYGKDYIYPSARTAAPFVRSGMQIARVPVLWERIQHQPGSALDPAEMARLDRTFRQLGAFRGGTIRVYDNKGAALNQIDQWIEPADFVAQLKY